MSKVLRQHTALFDQLYFYFLFISICSFSFLLFYELFFIIKYKMNEICKHAWRKKIKNKCDDNVTRRYLSTLSSHGWTSFYLTPQCITEVLQSIHMSESATLISKGILYKYMSFKRRNSLIQLLSWTFDDESVFKTFFSEKFTYCSIHICWWVPIRVCQHGDNTNHDGFNSVNW